MVRGVFEECPERREPRIAAADTVAAVFLQMVEKVEQQAAIEICERKRGRNLPSPRLGEAQQQTKGIAIGGHSSGTGGAVRSQLLYGEPAEQRGKCRCCVGTNGRSTRGR